VYGRGTYSFKVVLIFVGSDIQLATSHLQERYVESRFHYAPDEWPPYHPQHYTTLALIHHKGMPADAEVISVTQNMATKGNTIVKKSTLPSIHRAYRSKDISELFVSSSTEPKFILIEGAPGIGKTVLSKEIAFQWANKKLLRMNKLVFLVYLHDPKFKLINSIESLVEYIFRSKEIVAGVSKHLFETKGQDLTIIFDGYDEMSMEDRINSFAAVAISRDVLPKCGLVVTSRPTASLHLHDIADCRVEVLGFSEEDRLSFISHALQGVDDEDTKVKDLRAYLQSNSAVNALCYIPLNMTILLCLFNGMPNTTREKNTTSLLPRTQTQMYQQFIVMTITRSLKRNNVTFGSISADLSNLPDPYNKLFKEMTQLAYDALTKDIIVFDLQEIDFPNLTKTFSNWSGLGLLKATQFVDNSVSFHFLHFSIQEYLAALHIVSLSEKMQIELLQETFWNIRYFNTWIMYVGITCGKSFAWKHLLSGNRFALTTKVFGASKISKKLLNDKVKCLHLFQCFAEVGGDEAVGKLFEGQVIDLSGQTLSPNDVSTLAFFLMRSVNKHWKKLNLSSCNIGVLGCEILLKPFFDKSSSHRTKIDEVDISYNLLEINSIIALLEALKNCGTSVIVINEYNNEMLNHLFKEQLNVIHDALLYCQVLCIGSVLFATGANQKFFLGQLSRSANLTGIYLKDCTWEMHKFAIEEMHISCVKLQNLSKIHIESQGLPKIVILALITAIRLVDNVFVCDESLTDADVEELATVLKQKIDAKSPCVSLVTGGSKIIGHVNTSNLKEALSSTELLHFLKTIRRMCFNSKETLHLDDVDKVFLQDMLKVLHSKTTSSCQVAICLVERDNLIANKVPSEAIIARAASHNHLKFISISDCMFSETTYEVISEVIGKQESLESLFIFGSNLKVEFFSIFCTKLLHKPSTLKEFLVHTTLSNCILDSELLNAILPEKPSVATFLVTGTIIVVQKAIAELVSVAIQLEPTVAVWKFYNSGKFQQLARLLANSPTALVGLDISHCNLAKCTVDIGQVISYNTKLEQLNLCHNNLQANGVKNICKGMMNVVNLRELTVSHNKVDDEAARCIAAVLLHNTNLELLDLSHNQITSDVAWEIANALSY